MIYMPYIESISKYNTNYFYGIIIDTRAIKYLTTSLD
jgi:hypothetical protein